ncbi:TolC family protein [Desulfitobacterium sp. PCE1]|uniref:TolC family protein n=1 Tax=Desulfitobacterium sp. PCE1 TaxID=146907 RepID=UPI00035C6D61|nr:TolC family protein [Desulfitobacterium sp. PCE1]
MKKAVVSILLIGTMLVSTTSAVQANENKLDIEKVAIKSVENSQFIHSNNRQVKFVKKTYENLGTAVNQAKQGLVFFNSYELVKVVVLTPKAMENMMTQVTNGQAVVSNFVRISAYGEYISLLKADYALNTQADLMNSLYEDYKKARIQREQGLITQYELRLAEIAYEQARYNYLSAQNSRESAIMAINNMMGEDISKKYAVLQDNNITPSSQIKTLAEYTDLALANRVEIINKQNTLDLKKEQFRYDRAGMPTELDVQQQEYEIENLENELALTRIDVQQNISELYTGVESAMKKLEAMNYLAQQAEENYTAAQTSYENSLISLNDLNNAKIAKAQADINLKDAELDTWLVQTTMGMACNAGYMPTILQ